MSLRDGPQGEVGEGLGDESEDAAHILRLRVHRRTHPSDDDVHPMTLHLFYWNYFFFLSLPRDKRRLAKFVRICHIYV